MPKVFGTVDGILVAAQRAVERASQYYGYNLTNAHDAASFSAVRNMFYGLGDCGTNRDATTGIVNGTGHLQAEA